MVNASEFISKIDPNSTGFEIARAYYSEPAFLVPLITTIVGGFLLMLIIAAIVEGKTAGGKPIGKPMLISPNFGYVVIVFLIQLILMILVIFPVWMAFGG